MHALYSAAEGVYCFVKMITCMKPQRSVPIGEHSRWDDTVIIRQHYC